MNSKAFAASARLVYAALPTHIKSLHHGRETIKWGPEFIALEDITPGQLSEISASYGLAGRVAAQHEKDFATCSICHKYKGCWTDSGVCSECDEAEDERKMAENDAMTPQMVNEDEYDASNPNPPECDPRC